MSYRNIDVKVSRNPLRALISKWFWVRVWSFIRYWPFMGTAKYGMASSRFLRWLMADYSLKNIKVTAPDSVIDSLCDDMICFSKARAKYVAHKPILYFKALADIPCAIFESLKGYIERRNEVKFRRIKSVRLYFDFGTEGEIVIPGRHINTLSFKIENQHVTHWPVNGHSCTEREFDCASGALSFSIPKVANIRKVVKMLSKRNVIGLDVKYTNGNRETYYVPVKPIKAEGFEANAQQTLFYSTSIWNYKGFNYANGATTIPRKEACVDIYWECLPEDIAANTRLIKDCIKTDNWLLGVFGNEYNEKYYNPTVRKTAKKGGKKK